MNQSLCVEQRVVVKGNSGVIKEKLFDKFRIKVICILISIQMIVKTVLVFILDSYYTSATINFTLSSKFIARYSMSNNFSAETLIVYL